MSTIICPRVRRRATTSTIPTVSYSTEGWQRTWAVTNNTISGNGNNFFNLTTADGEVGLNVTVTSTQNNIVDIRQVRIAAETLPDPDPTPTPEPGTLALLGSAVLGLGGFARWRRKSA